MNQYFRQLMMEVGIVAAVTALLLTFVVGILGGIDTTRTALVVGAIIGAAAHVSFEFLGFNSMYCRVGAACM